ncbi:MAG: exodeoxyribonuclease VII small subunit [Isosphaeraceae bacterium]
MTTPDRPTFEDDLRRLEEVTDDLERGTPELSKALERYEEGVRLLARCQAALEQAERSVALLTGVEPDGTPITAPFDASATATGPPAEPPF